MLVGAGTLWESPTILGKSELQELLVCSGMDSRVPVFVVGTSKSAETPRKTGKGMVSWLPWKPYSRW